MTAVSLYEQMSELSARMVEAARDNDWSRLGSLQEKMSALRDELQLIDPPGGPLPTLSEAERLHKVKLIKRILAHDREVRVHTEPWMESVRALLGGGARGRAMRAAYGA